MHGQGIRGAGGAGQTSVGHDCAMCAQGVLHSRNSRRRLPGEQGFPGRSAGRQVSPVAAVPVREADSRCR